MKIIFCGTPQFAVPSLEQLADAGFEMTLVVTQPDRPRGRGMDSEPSPVKEIAIARNLTVVQPEKIKANREFQQLLESHKPEAIVVVGYGRIIPRWMIDLPPLGNINLHASLLPKYRGAAPIQWAIANGETVTGNTTMRIDAGLDTGDILLQEETAVLEADNALTLGPRLAASGAELLVRTLKGVADKKITAKPQDHTLASLAPILTKEDGRIDFQKSAEEIVNRLRGFQPWPGAFTIFRGKSLNIHQAKPVGETSLPPGMIHFSNNQLLAGAGHGSVVEILELQPEGKKRMSAKDFANGYRLTSPETLGQ